MHFAELECGGAGCVDDMWPDIGRGPMAWSGNAARDRPGRSFPKSVMDAIPRPFLQKRGTELAAPVLHGSPASHANPRPPSGLAGPQAPDANACAIQPADA